MWLCRYGGAPSICHAKMFPSGIDLNPMCGKLSQSHACCMVRVARIRSPWRKVFEADFSLTPPVDNYKPSATVG